MARRLRIAICAAQLMTACGLAAQLPEAPQQELQQRTEGPDSSQQKQPKPLFSLFPNQGTQFVNEKLPPQTVQEKFMAPTRNTLSAWAVIEPAFAAGYKQWRNTSPEFGHGPAGFGRYYWRTALDERSKDYMVGFVFPVLTHQDTRYYTLGHGGFWRRTEYALSRVVVTRNDAGNEVFNTSEIAGSGAAAGLTNLYYPSRQRTVSITMERWGLNVGFAALANVGTEFWPEVDRKLFHGKYQ